MGIKTAINRHVYDFSSVTITINGVIFADITELNYSQGLDPGLLRGTSAIIRGRSRGPYEADGSFTMYKETYHQLIKALAPLGSGGYMMAVFQIIAIYREIYGNTPITDTLDNCRIKHDEDGHSSGGEPLVVKADLSVMSLTRDGVPAVDVGGGGGGGLGNLLPF